MCMSVRITLTPPICTGGGMEYTPVSGAGACQGMRVRASPCAPYLVIILTYLLIRIGTAR